MSQAGAEAGNTDEAVVWMDGAVRTADEARITVVDRGVMVGAAAFETMKVIGGQAFALRRHLARLRRTCEVLRIPVAPSDDELRAAIAEAVEAAGPAAGRVRMTITGGTSAGRPPSLLVLVTPRTPPPLTVRCVTVPWRRNEKGATAGLKTTSYAENVIAIARAQELGADEPIFANTAGDLCEGATSNIFVGLGGVLVTPSLAAGGLAGVTRELLLEELARSSPPSTCVLEVDLPVEVLGRADEVFITSSTRGVAPVVDIDGRTFGAPGPLTLEAQRAWARIEAGPIDP